VCDLVMNKQRRGGCGWVVAKTCTSPSLGLHDPRDPTAGSLWSGSLPAGLTISTGAEAARNDVKPTRHSLRFQKQKQPKRGSKPWPWSRSLCSTSGSSASLPPQLHANRHRSQYEVVRVSTDLPVAALFHFCPRRCSQGNWAADADREEDGGRMRG